MSFDVPENGTLALVGESGSGKSVSAMSIVRLLPENAIVGAASRISFAGRDLRAASEDDLRRINVHGKRRILFLRGPIHQEDSIKRELGYASALQANGIPLDENLILNGDFERDVAYAVMNEFLGRDKQVTFDAVFTGDDDAAIGVLKSLHEHWIRIPEDVVVVGFDDLGFAPFLNPPLTTVRAPTEKVGQLATECLFGLLEDQPRNEVLILPTHIIFRRSCGCES